MNVISSNATNDVSTVVNQPAWNFLSNHALVIMCLMSDCEMRLRDMASHVGITERAIQRIITELESAGYLHKQRSGRRNSYYLDLNQVKEPAFANPTQKSEMIFLRMLCDMNRNGANVETATFSPPEILRIEQPSGFEPEPLFDSNAVQL